MTEPLFIGIDLGTARIKAGIYDRRGVEQALHIISHDGPLTAHRGQVTQDAERWWRAVRAALRALAAGVDPGRIAAIAVCGQGPTLVTTTARLRPCGPALTWMDKRAAPEAAELAALLGRPVDASHHLAKALRLSRVDPQPRRRWHLQSWDYIASRLSGVPHTSSTWFEDEIAASGLPREQFPPYVEPGRTVGALTAEVARTCGLPPSIPVVAGTNDGIASCIGSGLIARGSSVILGGTSGGFVLCWDPLPGVWAPPPGAYPEPPGLRYLGAAVSSSGLALDWLASLFGVRDYDRWLRQAGAVPVGADGLVLLPYLAGLFLPYTVDDRAPLVDPTARGVLLGLHATHTVGHLIRSVMEGVAFAIRQVRDATLAQGGATDAAVTVGGQAHSPLWNHIKADVLRVPVLVPAVVEAGALGAACLASAGSGHYSSIWNAAAAMVRIAARLEPDPAAAARYEQLYQDVYRPLYPSVRGLFQRL